MGESASAKGQWTANGWSMRMQASCRGSSNQKATSERETKASTAGPRHAFSSSQLSSRPLVWPSIVGSQQGRILQRHGTLGFGPWPTPSCSPPMRNAAAAAAWSFRAFTFASTPQKDDNRRPPNLCHPSSCFDLQVQAAKYG